MCDILPHEVCPCYGLATRTAFSRCRNVRERISANCWCSAW